MAAAMRACKGKVMVSINDHPDIRRAFDSFPMLGLSIKYSVNNTSGSGASTNRELVITNWEPGTETGGLF
ncbi:DNA adenine methylase [Trinickia caryophylli]|uniref:DNA adenine methylase n=1 Tax=Trinickia caryophylli TaxID=28094 RepID=A0A1X7F2R7_TRICW|nr:DNA adenine methylase [Trinickia caryophylli]